LCIVAWHVPSATHDIIDVVANLGGLGSVFAGTDTKLGRGHEILEYDEQKEDR
jgi:hypothetical protein